MGMLSGLFHSRDKPQNRTVGSSYSFFLSNSTSGKPITERSAMQMTAVYSCVRILAEAVSGLPVHLYRYTEDGGKEKALDHGMKGGDFLKQFIQSDVAEQFEQGNPKYIAGKSGLELSLTMSTTIPHGTVLLTEMVFRPLTAFPIHMTCRHNSTEKVRKLSKRVRNQTNPGPAGRGGPITQRQPPSWRLPHSILFSSSEKICS